MPILTVYIIITLTIFGAGFTTAYNIEHSKVSALELQIKLSNEESKNKLLEATAVTEALEQEQNITNENLETEHAKNIKLNGDLSNSLATVRMRVTTKHTNCNNTLSTGSDSSVTIDSTDTIELPDDFKDLLRSETLRADNLAVYANESFNFVKSNCGIKP